MRTLRDFACSIVGGLYGVGIAQSIMRGEWLWLLALVVGGVLFSVYWLSDLRMLRAFRARKRREWRARGKCYGCGGEWHRGKCPPRCFRHGGVFYVGCMGICTKAPIGASGGCARAS